MSFSQTKAKSSATNAAAAVAGGIITHKALQVLAEKAPEAVRKYVGLIVAGGAILAPAMLDIKSDAVSSALQGAAMMGTISGVNAITAGEETGWKASVAKLVPQLGSVDALPLYSYTEATAGLLEAGSQYREPVAVVPQKNAVQSLFS